MEYCFIYGKHRIFALFTAHFGGFEGVFSFTNDKSAILYLVGKEVADFLCLMRNFKIVGVNRQIEFCLVSESE